MHSPAGVGARDADWNRDDVLRRAPPEVELPESCDVRASVWQKFSHEGELAVVSLDVVTGLPFDKGCSTVKLA